MVGEGRGAYSKRLVCVPVLRLDLEGLAIHVRMRGITFFSAQTGLTQAALCAIGPTCVCGDATDASQVRKERDQDIQEIPSNSCLLIRCISKEG